MFSFADLFVYTVDGIVFKYVRLSEQTSESPVHWKKNKCTSEQKNQVTQGASRRAARLNYASVVSRLCVPLVSLLVTLEATSAAGLPREEEVYADGRQCFARLGSRFNSTFPLGVAEQEAGEEPYEYVPHCLDSHQPHEFDEPLDQQDLEALEARECLFMTDANVANLQAAALAYFPIFENVERPLVSPKSGWELVRNAKIIMDEHSYMHIHGVGFFKGPVSIGS